MKHEIFIRKAGPEVVLILAVLDRRVIDAQSWPTSTMWQRVLARRAVQRFGFDGRMPWTWIDQNGDLGNWWYFEIKPECARKSYHGYGWNHTPSSLVGFPVFELYETKETQP